MSFAQRRRWERCRKTLDVVVQTYDGRALRATTQDVCEGGLGILCDEPLSAGAQCGFLIAAIDAQPLPGVVRWCTASPALGTNVVGIELTAMSARQTEAIADRIAAWKAEEAAGSDG